LITEPRAMNRWEEFEVTRQQLGPRLIELIRAAQGRRRFTRPAGHERLAGMWLRLAA
jgi:hypothetical protein